MKAIVFDVDNTIGNFQECSTLFSQMYKNGTQQQFNMLMDRHPDYLRPDIIFVFHYIQLFRKKYPCKVFLFTNNIGGRPWMTYIKNYIHYLVKDKVIDHMILAKQFEPKRLSESKTFDDFKRCSSMPANTPVFFIDDQYHPGMNTDGVYYLHVKPYNREVGDVAAQYILQHLKSFMREPILKG